MIRRELLAASLGATSPAASGDAFPAAASSPVATGLEPVTARDGHVDALHRLLDVGLIPAARRGG